MSANARTGASVFNAVITNTSATDHTVPLFWLAFGKK